jgi:CHAT domain-containing protein
MSAAPPVRIEPGQRVGRLLAAGETHPYLVRLEAGEYVRIIAEQRGVDLILRLLAPDGGVIAEVDSPTGTRGAERVSEIAVTAGDYRTEVVGADETPPGEYEIRIEDRRPATAADRKRVEGERVFLEGEDLRRGKDFEEAITRFKRALRLWREAGDRVGEADALHRLGLMQERLERWLQAADLSGQAAEVYRETGNLTGQAESLNRRGRLLGRLGRYGEAQTVLEEAVQLFRADGNLSGEATALSNLGTIHLWNSRFHEAVDAYEEAQIILHRLGLQSKEALALLNMGELYLAWAKLPEARDRFEKALRIVEDLGDRESAAVALESLGELNHREGRFDDSRQQLERALGIYRELGNRRGQASTLNALGTVHLKSGDPSAAGKFHKEARRLYQELGDIQGEATALSSLGRAAFAEGDSRQALEHYHAARPLFDKLGDRPGQALIHYGIGQALVQQGDLEGGLRDLESCLEVVEEIRAGADGLNLRAFYFASKQHYWDLYIDVLMRLDEQRPGKRFAAKAVEAAERRRARSLLDALSDLQSEARKEITPALLQEDRKTRDLLRTAEELRRTALQDVDTKRVEALDQEIRIHLARLDYVRARMRRASPRLKALDSPPVLSLKKIQKSLLDSKTLLLVYSLGEERSFLWAVTKTSLTSHILPGREKIEKSAFLVHDLMSRRLRPSTSRLRQSAVDDLTSMVLAPVVEDLTKHERLLIVADGALQAVPFAALSEPGSVPRGAAKRRPLLLEQHEITLLPSASVVTRLRQGRPLAVPVRRPPLIAIVAEPVFGKPDPESHRTLARSAGDLGLERFERLPYSGIEAEAIAKMVRPEYVFKVTGSAAVREVFEDSRVQRAPILHLATHSLIDDRQPELSGLVFSFFGPDGAPRRNAFLQVHEIYDLNLKSDLAVLSSCETGSGRDVRGEGFLGMAHAFMAAGVPQVVMSLWSVEDEATKNLMIHFYRELLDEGRLPPDALRRAQLAMIREGRSDPSLWAGFVFLGDFGLRPGGGIEASDNGGTEPAKRASNDMPVEPGPDEPPKKDSTRLTRSTRGNF